MSAAGLDQQKMKFDYLMPGKRATSQHLWKCGGPVAFPYQPELQRSRRVRQHRVWLDGTIAGFFGSLWDSTRSFSHLTASERVAQFPAGPPETDGAVILNTAFGTKGTAAAPFNLG